MSFLRERSSIVFDNLERYPFSGRREIVNIVLEIVNITAGGNLGRELDLVEVTRDLEAYSVEYNAEKYPGLIIKFEEDSPISTIYTSGKYVITGTNSIKQTQVVFDKLVASMDALSIDVVRDKPTIYNIVFTADVNTNLHLPHLATNLGLNKTEYEPEQSPFLVYRPDHTNCTFTIPATGKIVITGVKDEKTAQSAFEELLSKINDLYS